MSKLNEQLIAVGYTRRSQEDKQTAEYSLENQGKEIRKFCEKNNYKLLKIFNEGYKSGSDWDRPVFNRMIELVKEKLFNIIVVTDSDRFSRDSSLTKTKVEYFIAYKIKLLDVSNHDWTDDPMVTAFLSDAKEIVTQKGRTKQKKMIDEKKDAGGIFGDVPFGYKTTPIFVIKDNRKKVSKKWEVDEEQAKKVKEIYKMFIENYSFVDISNLTEVKIPTIKKILRNKKYYGVFPYKKRSKIIDTDRKQKWVVVEEGEFKIKQIPPLITEETFNKAQQLLKEKGYK